MTTKTGSGTLRGLVALAAALALATVLSAQQRDVRVAAQLSSGVLRFGDFGRLAIVVENADRAGIVALPEVEGLAFGDPTGPARQSFSRFSNGRYSSTTTFTWTVDVRPLEPGDYEIPPVRVSVDGQEMSTRPLSLRVVRDLEGADLGFLEVHTAPAHVVEGQPFSVELRFGWEEGLEVNFANLVLPWWGELPGTLDLGDRGLPPDANAVQGVSINDRIQVVVEQLPPTQHQGRSLLTMRLVKSFVPTRSGALEFPTSFLEFGKSIRSGGFFATSRRKTESYYVEAPALVLEVAKLPEEGQPFDYSGAVGALEARARVDTRDVAVGDSLKLVVDWTGDGNLEFFTPPDPGRLDAFRGFRVYGMTEEKSFDRRRVTYDIAPVDPDVTEIPPVPLSVFDPEEGRYVEVETEPIPIRVRALEGAVDLGSGQRRTFEDDILDIDARPLTETDSGVRVPGDGALAAGLVAVPLVWLSLRIGARRAGDPASPLERRRRRARRTLARDLGRAADAKAELDLFQRFLAARTREPDEAWSGREALAGLDGRADVLEKLGPDGRAAFVDVRARLERAVFGSGPRVPQQEISALADRLTRAGL